MRIVSRCHPRTSHASLCLDRHIGKKELLVAQIQSSQHRRNSSGERIKWMCTTEKHVRKWFHAYPSPSAFVA